MTYLGDTGQGSTIVLSGDDGLICAGCPRTIQLPELSMEGIDTTCLDSVGFMQRIPADVADPGVLEVTFIFDAGKEEFGKGAATSFNLFSSGSIVDVTISLPESRSTTSQAAIFTASGFVSSLGLPSLETSTLMELTISIQMDGASGPNLTIETPIVTC